MMSVSPTKGFSLLGNCIKNAICRRPQTTILAIGFFLFLYFFFMLIKSRKGVHEETVEEWEARMEDERVRILAEHITYYVKPKNLQPLPMYWTDKEKCPACFGTDICGAIERKEVLVEIPKSDTDTSMKGVFFGSWKEIPVVVKRLSSQPYPNEFRSFDKFICMNASGSEKCNISPAVLNKTGLVQQENTFDPAFLFDSWKIAYPNEGPLSLPFSLCLTSNLIDTFAKLYGSNSEDKLENLSPEQRSILFTTMVVQPEALVLKFMKDKQFHKIAPKYLGACGRLIVVEHGGAMLERYLNESFNERAELALQLLGLVGLLWHTDPSWFALYKYFEYDNIAVSHDREVFLIDFEELIIIESSDSEPDVHSEYDQSIVCNKDCFNELWRNLSDQRLSISGRYEQCQSLHLISSAYMYSTLCQNVLSDLKEHREAADNGGKKYRGLLHSIPTSGELAASDSLINNALKECVHETSAGARENAVNKLSEYLFTYMKHLG